MTTTFLALWGIKASVLFLGYLGLRAMLSPRGRRGLGIFCACGVLALPLAETFMPVRIAVEVGQAAPPPMPSGGMAWPVWVWLVGVLGVAAHVLVARWALGRLYRRSQLVSRDGLELRIAEDSRLKTALTWGWPRAVVMLPSEASSWPGEQLGAVIAHELAHVRRADSFFHHVALAACAALWFNPLAWLAAAKLREDFEAVADEAVLETGIRPTAYAGILLTMAGGRPVSSTALAAVRQSRLTTRISAIVRPRRDKKRWTAVAGTILFLGLYAGVALAQLASPRSKEWLQGYAEGFRYAAIHHSGHEKSASSFDGAEKKRIELEQIERLRRRPIR